MVVENGGVHTSNGFGDRQKFVTLPEPSLPGLPGYLEWSMTGKPERRGLLRRFGTGMYVKSGSG